MYHISNLGSFAGSIGNPNDPAFYADTQGFVPQSGDDPEPGYTADEWEDRVAGAVRATYYAEKRAQEWRDRNG